MFTCEVHYKASGWLSYYNHDDRFYLQGIITCEEREQYESVP